MKPAYISLTISLIFLLLSCVTAPVSTVSDTEQQDNTVITEPETATEESANISEESAPVSTEPEESEYKVTEEEYTRTFDTIEMVISELNSIIKAQDYDRWIRYLTTAYQEKYNDPETLKEISDQPILKKYNLKLRNLHDYFTYVVVSSRQNARLDEIVFIDSTHIKALMMIDDVPYLLYLLENVDGEWKIGIW